MGKTVKSRSIMSAASFLLVIAFCLVANKGVPKLYESYKQKEVAQQASVQATQVIKKQSPTKDITATTDDTSAPASEPAEDTSASDDANVYDIPEEPAVDEEPAESADEESSEDFDIDTGADKGDTKTEKTSLLDKILNFFTSLFDKIKSFNLLGKLKDVFVKFLKLFGVTV